MRHPGRLPLEELAPYLLPLPDSPAPLDWSAVFGNDHPVELEVGFGKGLFLLNAALANPDVNFAGIEIVRKYQLYSATRMAKRALRNVRLALGDGKLLLRDYVPADSLRAVHVYFPDPWWKKRHHKRRVFTPEFAALAWRALRPGGRLYVATDVEEYFGLVREATAPLDDLRELPSAPEEDGYRTNFERKAREGGRSVFRVTYERR